MADDDVRFFLPVLKIGKSYTLLGYDPHLHDTESDAKTYIEEQRPFYPEETEFRILVSLDPLELESLEEDSWKYNDLCD